MVPAAGSGVLDTRSADVAVGAAVERASVSPRWRFNTQNASFESGKSALLRTVPKMLVLDGPPQLFELRLVLPAAGVRALSSRTSDVVITLGSAQRPQLVRSSGLYIRGNAFVRKQSERNLRRGPDCGIWARSMQLVPALTNHAAGKVS